MRFGDIAKFRKIRLTGRRRSVQGSSLVSTLVAIVILTLVFAGGFMAIENDGTATAVQASQVQATTVADSILNLEQANPGCGNYTAMSASATGSSLNLGALSTWNTSLGSATIGTANGDWNISGADSWTYIGTGSPAGWQYPYSQPVTVSTGETLQLSANIDARNTTAGGPGMGIYTYVPGVGMDSGEFGMWQTSGVDSTLSGQWTVPQGVSQIVVFPDTSNATVTAGQPLIWSQIQLSVVGTLSGANSQLTPCEVAVPAGEYYQAASDTQQPPASLSSCGSEPQVTTLNLEQASPSPWFCVNYSGQVLWGYAESSWVVPAADASVCPGSSGESSAVAVARLLERTIVLKSQVLNQPVRTYAISRTTAPSVGPLPAGELSAGGLKSVMITGVPQGDFAELAMNLWTGGTGGASQAQVLVTGSPNSSGQIFFPAIPADATGVEYWITSTPSLKNPPSVASGTQIPPLSNTVTCEAG